MVGSEEVILSVADPVDLQAPYDKFTSPLSRREENAHCNTYVFLDESTISSPVGSFRVLQ